MTRQTKRLGAGAMDFGLLSPCPVHVGWYERYCYRDNSLSRVGILLNAVRRRELLGPGWAWLAICRGAFSSLKHRSATAAARQACEASGD